MLRLERHRLGPRVYVLGLRIHEFALGFALLAALLAGGVVDAWALTHRTEAVTAAGSWLVAQASRSSYPSKRNTGRWSLLPHRVPRDG